LQWLPWLNRGLWAEAQGEREEALAAYRRVLVLEPELAGSPFWQQGQRAGWWDDLLAGGDRYWQWQVLLASQQQEQVVGETDEWLTSHPKDPEALAYRGEALLGLGRADQALELMTQALSMAPARAQSYLVRGDAYLALGEDGRAERDLRTALFLEPSGRAHLSLARLALSHRDIKDALEHYSRAVSPMTLSQSAYVVLYHRLGWPAPLPQVTRIASGSDQEAALEWGKILEQEGDWATAQEVYESALAMDPSFVEVEQRLVRLDSR
jgi:tetratricopeptide (TPR) repeat protein